MRLIGLIIGTFLGAFLLLAPVAASAAPAEGQSVRDYCLEKLGIEIREGEINFVYEREHDPQLSLLRRCINDERKVMVQERKIERQRVRETARFRRSSEKSHKLREKVEHGVNKAIRRKILKGTQFRAPTGTLDAEVFRAGRRSRRAVVQGKEHADRAEGVRRKRIRDRHADRCKAVRVISENAICGKGVQYKDLKQRGKPAWYRRG